MVALVAGTVPIIMITLRLLDLCHLLSFCIALHGSSVS